MTDIGAALARIEKRLDRVERAARLSYASLDDTALEVRDGGGSLRAMVGQQGDGTTAVNIVNGPPPPQPSTPIAASVLGGVTASWDGQFADGTVMPLDWSRIEVHAAAATGFTPDATTLRSTIETAQGATVVIPTDTPVYVCLVARSTSGTPSLPSVQAGPLGPAPVVATDILDGIVTTVKLANNAVTSTKLAAAAVDTAALAQGAVTINALGGPASDLAAQRYVDAMTDPAAWTLLTKAAAATWDFVTGVSDAPTGPSVGRATGYVVVRGRVQVPYDPDTLYRISARVRTTASSTAASNTVYFGALGIAADGTTYVARDGSNSYYSAHYAAASRTSQPTASGWVVYTGYLKGRALVGQTGTPGVVPDPRAPGVLHDSARYIAPVFILNFESGTSGVNSGTGVMQIDAVTVEALKTGVIGGTNILAGAVSTAALTADAVTAGKIAADAVTARELTANSVTTAKIVAGAVQAAQLDAEAVNASKIAAGAVTTAKLDALAVTTDKLAANAITVGKIAAGSVDAAALKADAITGKTITGGIINGAEFHSDDRAGGLVDIKNGTVVTTAASGWKILIDPSQSLPVLDFLDSTGATAGSINGTGDPASPGLNISSGPFTDGAVTDWRWVTRLGADGPSSNGWRTVRVKASNPAVFSGGTLQLAPSQAIVGVVDSASPATNTIVQVDPGAFTLSEGRVIVAPPASSSSAIWLNAKAGHTGNLFRITLNSIDRFAVTSTGAVSAASVAATGGISADSLTVANTTFTTYTPTVAGGGTATFSVRDGWYYRLGGLVFFEAYIAPSAAGSGSANVTFTLPSTPYRGAANRRQAIPVHVGALGNCMAIIAAGGTGAAVDSIALNSGSNIVGSQLTASTIITATGWYREA